MTCRDCGAENQPGASACKMCGSPLAAAGPTGPGMDPESLRRKAEADAKLKAGRRRERIIVPAMVTIIIVLIGSMVAFFPKEKLAEAAPDLTLDYPSVTVDRYYAALAEQNHTAAHELLEPDVQSAVTVQQMEMLYGGQAGPAISSHSLKDTGTTDAANAYVAVSLNGKPGFVWLTKNGDSGWRIWWTLELGEATGLPCPV